MNHNARTTIPLAAARHVVAELGLSSPDEIDVELIAAHHGAFVRERPLHGADGMMVRKGDEALISVRASIPEPGKKRFVAAHELGHVLLHPHARQHDLCALGEVDHLSYQRSAEELEANYFAAELLMPEKMFATATGKDVPSFAEINRLAASFNTTLSATAIQYVKYSKEPCVFVISKGLLKPWFFIPEQFEFRVAWHERIHGPSCAAAIAKSGERLMRASDVPAGVWLEGFSDRGKDYITEESLALGGTGIIYTLLWIHDAI